MAHLADYPMLAFPHMFIIAGGYRRFHDELPQLCDPCGGYVRMADPAYTAQLRDMHSRHREVWRKKSMTGGARGRPALDGEEGGSTRRSLCSPGPRG